MRVTLSFSCAPRQVEEATLELPADATVGQALAASGWAQRFPLLQGLQRDVAQVTVGVWGHKANLHTQLREGDRVEFYRALRVDPKVARRERFNKQGARGAGLFAKRRPGGKAGY